jgi:hypothetical protein
MWRSVDIVLNDVSEERIASIFRVEEERRETSRARNQREQVLIGFVCVSLGSSTVQLHDSLASRSARAYSEAGFSSQNGDHA